jgi:DNA-binding PadR family transcriptional regulator
MIYIVIYKLEAEGLLETKMDGRRKIMKITKNGSETLKEAREYMKKLGERL